MIVRAVPQHNPGVLPADHDIVPADHGMVPTYHELVPAEIGIVRAVPWWNLVCSRYNPGGDPNLAVVYKLGSKFSSSSVSHVLIEDGRPREPDKLATTVEPSADVTRLVQQRHGRVKKDREDLYGCVLGLRDEYSLEDVRDFKNFVRVEPAMFEELVQRGGPRIWRQDTSYHKALEPGLKMTVTLRYLASDDN